MPPSAREGDGDDRRAPARRVARHRAGLRPHARAGRLPDPRRATQLWASRRPRSATTWRRWRRPATSPQPHTSAGRVPTDKGYRLFVDRLTTVKPLSLRRAAGHSQTLLDDAVDLDDVVDRTVRLLASLDASGSGGPVPVAAPVRAAARGSPAARPRRAAAARAHHGQRSGRAASSSRPRRPSTPDRRRRLAASALNTTCRWPAHAHARLDAHPSCPRCSRPRGPPARGDGVRAGPRDGRARRSRSAWCSPGAANLARVDVLDFAGSIGPVLDALDEQVVLMRLLQEMAQDEAASTVRIGHENPLRGARRDLGGHGRLRDRRCRQRRPARGARPDPDGLPGHDGGRARRRPLPFAAPLSLITPTCPPLTPHQESR